MDIWNYYLDWITDNYIPGINSVRSRKKLLLTLLNTEFIPVLENDENRIEDAKDIRYQFGHLMVSHRIGVLEIMVALANRAEQSIMRDDDIGNRTTYWFMMMLRSLGLEDMTDEVFNERVVNCILDSFIKREYAPNGSGGLFTVRPPHRDMRKLELWDQLCLYLDDILADEGLIERRQ